MIRSLLELSSRQARRRIPRQVFGQRSSLSSRREFSSTPRKNGPSEPAKPGRPPESGSSFPTYIVGGVAIGAAIMAAYKSGYLDQMLGEEKHDSLGPSMVVFDEKDKNRIHQDAKPFEHMGEEKVSEVLQELSPKKDDAGKVETPSAAPHLGTLNEREVKGQSYVEEKSEVMPGKGNVVDQEKDLPISSEVSTKERADSGILSEARPDMQNPSTLKRPGEEVPVEQLASQVNSVTNLDEVKSVQQHDLGAEGRREDASGPNIGTPSSLLEAYHLKDKSEQRTSASLGRYAENEAFTGVTEGLDDSVATKDGKLILDFLQAIHAAEKRQAELDSRVFAEEKRAMKENYEKELKDAIARELMHAEEAALLDKELKRERAKAVATVQALQQKLEEKHKMELQQKEAESELKLKKVEELAKAETAAMIAREKAAQIEKMAEANLHTFKLFPHAYIGPSGLPELFRMASQHFGDILSEFIGKLASTADIAKLLVPLKRACIANRGRLVVPYEYIPHMRDSDMERRPEGDGHNFQSTGEDDCNQSLLSSSREHTVTDPTMSNVGTSSTVSGRSLKKLKRVKQKSDIFFRDSRQKQCTSEALAKIGNKRKRSATRERGLRGGPAG